MPSRPSRKAQSITPIDTFDFINYLQLMANALKFEVMYYPVEEKSVTGQFQTILYLLRHPLSAYYGFGLNVVDAENDAARKAVEYLQKEARTVEYFYC